MERNCKESLDMKGKKIIVTAESNNKQTSVITKSYSTNNRAPKLRSLKNQAVFSETIGSVDSNADLSPQVRPKVWLI